MSNELRYVGSVKDGKLHIVNRKGFDADLEGFEGCRVLIGIKTYRKSRSTKQNAFYWGNFMQSEVDCFKEFWGETYSKEQVHDWNKSKFWAEEAFDEHTGEVIMKPASSTDNSTVEWEEKLEKIRQWFRQTWEWELPFPNEQSEINY